MRCGITTGKHEEKFNILCWLFIELYHLTSYANHTQLPGLSKHNLPKADGSVVPVHSPQNLSKPPINSEFIYLSA